MTAPFRIVYCDVAGWCNARCPYCQTGSRGKRPGTLLARESFREILARLSRGGAIGPDTLIGLYNWGEPCLHPDLGGLAAEVGALGLKYALSTNASVVPAIDGPFVRNLDHLIFSMCGFSQESYDRVHGFRLDAIRRNIVEIVGRCRACGFRGDFILSYHVYGFNRHEMAACEEFASANGIVFNPYYAILNDWRELVAFTRGALGPERVERLSRDLVGMDAVAETMKRIPPGYVCPQREYLVVTEEGEVLPCCQLPKDVPEFSCGNVLRDDLGEILRKRSAAPVCRECMESGLAYYINGSLKPPADYVKSERQALLARKKAPRRRLLPRLGAFRGLFDYDPFRLGLRGLLTNPFYFAQKGLYRHISELARHVRGKTLDVGCGVKPYEALFPSSAYVGLEIDSPDNRTHKKADVFYGGGALPFADSEFDSVVSFQVLEHVFDPGTFLREINRVLRPGGALLLTVPFVWDEHEQPHDFARYSSFGLASILGRHGFEIVEARKSMNDIRAVFQLLNGYTYKKVAAAGSRRRKVIATIALMAPFNLMGELLARLLPRNDDLYLDNVVLARKAREAGSP